MSPLTSDILAAGFANGRLRNELWDAIGAFSELIGAVAVVISLVYLAIQIRQNTRQVEESTIEGQTAALHSSLSYAVDNRIATFSDENTALIYLRGLKETESLNEVEQLRFRLMFANVVDAGWNMYSQSKMTGFSPEAWKAQARTIIPLLDTNSGKWFWDNYGSEYHQDFQIEIERISAGGSWQIRIDSSQPRTYPLVEQAE